MIETLKKGVRYRTPLKKLTNGLPKGSPSRPRSYLNANRQSDSFTSPEIRPRKFQPHSGRHRTIFTRFQIGSGIIVFLTVPSLCQIACFEGSALDASRSCGAYAELGISVLNPDGRARLVDRIRPNGCSIINLKTRASLSVRALALLQSRGA